VDISDEDVSQANSRKSQAKSEDQAQGGALPDGFDLANFASNQFGRTGVRRKLEEDIEIPVLYVDSNNIPRYALTELLIPKDPAIIE
jgi:hypothetical protein